MTDRKLVRLDKIEPKPITSYIPHISSSISLEFQGGPSLGVAACGDMEEAEELALEWGELWEEVFLTAVGER